MYQERKTSAAWLYVSFAAAASNPDGWAGPG